MSEKNLEKFYLGALDRVRDGALGMLGSGSPRSLAHHAYAWTYSFDGLGTGTHPQQRAKRPLPSPPSAGKVDGALRPPFSLIYRVITGILQQCYR